MSKGYWVASVTVYDVERYSQYQVLAAKALEKYGAIFLVRGGESTSLEGSDALERNVLMEFSSYAKALECYHSVEYQAARKLRQGAATVDIKIMNGIVA